MYIHIYIYITYTGETSRVAFTASAVPRVQPFPYRVVIWCPVVYCSCIIVVCMLLVLLDLCCYYCVPSCPIMSCRAASNRFASLRISRRVRGASWRVLARRSAARGAAAILCPSCRLADVRLARRLRDVAWPLYGERDVCVCVRCSTYAPVSHNGCHM